MIGLDRSTTVAGIVTEHPILGRVFQRHGIDYCCHGDVSVPEASRTAHLDPDALYAELERALAAGGAAPAGSPRTLSTAALVARIVDRHHGYLREALPAIAPVAAKVARVHGPKDGSLHLVHETFGRLSAALLPHLDEEESVLFPAMVAREPDRALLARELGRMHQDHREVGAMLARLRELTGGYATPSWGCNTYRALLAELERLEADVLEHVHLENHVLAPRFAA